jgi:oxygen-independent coproporphyrinogen-3 oxidase
MMIMQSDFPLYKFWNDYPNRDVEYVRWYPPTLETIDPQSILDNVATGPENIGFYLHVPFCKDICPYCPFNKFSMKPARAAEFVDGVAKEIRMVSEQHRKRGATVTAGYFGGGTPTALDINDLVGIIEQCFDGFNISPGAELSIEANPDTVDLEMLRVLRSSGINRISFGVQSLQDRFLAVIGRTHSAREAIRAIELARQAGFDNIAIDLMYRLPGQTIDDWRHDLTTALSVGVEHISTYCLFLDPGTRMYNETIAGHVSEYPVEEEEVAMYQLTLDVLGRTGFHHYTINDFALAGRESEHHLINWQAPQRSYVGMGPGAFGYIDGEEGSYIYCTIHSLRDYLASLEQDLLPVRIGKKLSDAERQARYMVLGLRCLEVGKQEFRHTFGLELDEVFAEPLARLHEWGLVASDEEKVWMTDKGKHYATNVLKAFYTPANVGKPQPIGVELMAGRGLSMVSVDFSKR